MSLACQTLTPVKVEWTAQYRQGQVRLWMNPHPINDMLTVVKNSANLRQTSNAGAGRTPMVGSLQLLDRSALPLPCGRIWPLRWAIRLRAATRLAARLANERFKLCACPLDNRAQLGDALRLVD